MSVRKYVLILVLIWGELLIAKFPTEFPFWKTKPKLYKKIQEDKYIVVSARLTKEKKEKMMRIVSAGHIQAPLDYSWNRVLDFSNYVKVTKYITKAHYNPKTKQLFLRMEVYGYVASMWMQLKMTDTHKGKSIFYEVIKGNFVGLKGYIHLISFGPKITEISSYGKLIAKEIPLPAVLVNIGMEVAGRQITSKMRSYIEVAFKGQ